MTCNVYWIRHKDHTDMFSQGYIGVSKNCNKRWLEHSKSTNNYLKNAIKKYGWDNLVKSVVVVASEEYCFMLENSLRPTDKTGWNLCAGGGKPPSWEGKKHKLSTREKMKSAQIGAKNAMFKGHIESTNIATGEKNIFAGAKELKAFGFQHENVYACISGKHKTHKGHTFRRVTA